MAQIERTADYKCENCGTVYRDLPLDQVHYCVIGHIAGDQVPLKRIFSVPLITTAWGNENLPKDQGTAKD